MRIRSLQLEQFKKFDQPVLIEGFSDRLNLIAGPNEMGKSTLLLALRAALFERHSSKSQAIKALQPNHIQGAAPSVVVELELDDGHYRIEKRFLRRPLARLVRPNGEIVEGNEAEAEIRNILRLERDDALPLDKGIPGHFGLMLIPQSQSFYQPSLTQGTRHTLEEAVTGEIEQLGNQSEVDAVLANIEMAMLEIVDRRAKPKGRYKDVEARLNDLESEVEILTRDRDELSSDIDALNEAERTLCSLENIEAEDDLKAKLTHLEGLRVDLVRRKEIEAKIAAARLRVERLRFTRDERQKCQDERRRLTNELDLVDKEEAPARALLEEGETELKGHLAKRQSLEEAADTIRQKRQCYKELSSRLQQRSEIENALLAAATEVTIDLDSEAVDRVQLNGRPLDRASDVLQVVDGLEIDIQDVGRVKVQPKFDQLERLREHRATLDRSIDELAESLGLDVIESESIEALWKETEEEARDLAANRADLDGVIKDLEQAIEKKRHAVLTLATRRQQIEERLTQLGERSPTDDNGNDQTEKQLAEAEADFAAAEDIEKSYAPIDQLTPKTLDQLEAEIKSSREKMERHSKHIGEAKLTIERLSAKVSLRAGRGLDERIDECHRRLEILGQEQARFQLDTRAFTLLTEALTEAANDAKAHFHAPLAARLRPYLQALLPDAELDVTPDFGVAALHRGQPTAERFEQLSDGTREQIAILARLAFARMLQEQGLPALVVLDDALVFSDRGRLVRMFDILEDAAKDLQIIILTCREDRFLDLKAKRLHIKAVDPAVEVASA